MVPHRVGLKGKTNIRTECETDRQTDLYLAQIYIYIYRERERERGPREKEREAHPLILHDTPRTPNIS